MTKKELEAMVSAVKSPPLDRKQTRKLFEENSNIEFQQNNDNQVVQAKPQQVAQPVAQQVAQQVAQKVAQEKLKSVAQEVAQVLWVAQVVPQKVTQTKLKVVAQDRPQMVSQSKSKVVAQPKSKVAQNERIKDKDELLIEKYVNELKAQISKIQGVDERKRFIRDVGWGVMTEKRGRKYYLFGAKKLGGRKYKLYVGNATN